MGTARIVKNHLYSKKRQNSTRNGKGVKGQLRSARKWGDNPIKKSKQLMVSMIQHPVPRQETDSSSNGCSRWVYRKEPGSSI